MLYKLDRQINRDPAVLDDETFEKNIAKGEYEYANVSYRDIKNLS